MQGWCLAFIPFEKRVVGPNGEIDSHSRVARPLVYAHDACKADKTPPTSVNCSQARRHSRYARRRGRWRVQAGSLRHRRRGPRYLSSSLPVRVPAPSSSPVRVGVRAPWNSMELRGTPWNSVLSLGLTHHEGRPMSSGLVSKEFEAFARDCVQLAAQADSQELRERLLSIARDWMRAAMEEDDATPSTNRALRRRKLQPSRGAA
jgi:hypothetical protein